MVLHISVADDEVMVKGCGTRPGKPRLNVHSGGTRHTRISLPKTSDQFILRDKIYRPVFKELGSVVAEFSSGILISVDANFSPGVGTSEVNTASL